MRQPVTVIEAENLSKTYASAGDSRASGPVGALREVSFSIRRGEKVAIVGRSGSGKSTLLNLLGMLDVPTRGSLKLSGVDVSGLGDRARTTLRQRQIGFVFQFFNLLPTLSALENVMLPSIFAGCAIRDAHRQSLQRLEEVGLGHRASHHPYQMSGGEMQRTAIARALVLDPPVLLADEPTGNLDTETGESILELLMGTASEGRTVVVVTHDPGIAARLDRILGMRDGRIEYDRITRRRDPAPGGLVELSS